MADRKKVSLQYRKLATINDFALSLQTALANAVAHPIGASTFGNDVSSRRCDEDLEYGTLVLNYILDDPNFFFGELVRFEMGADLPLLKLGAGKVYDLTQAKAPDGHEAVRGVLYFMAVKNHVILLEGGIASSRLERYLTWTLAKIVKVVPEASQVLLDAEFTTPGDTRKLAEVEHIVLKPRALTEPMTKAAEELVEQTHTAKREVASTNTFDVLLAAGFGRADIEELVKEKTDLEVRIEIKFKSENRRRKVLGAEQASRLLRNLPEDELTLTGPGGRGSGPKCVRKAILLQTEEPGYWFDGPRFGRLETLSRNLRVACSP